MIMSTATFRSQLSNFKRLVYTPHSFRSFNTSFRDNKARPAEPEDILILEMIKNVDFYILYRSVEFRSKLRERLYYYGKG